MANLENDPFAELGAQAARRIVGQLLRFSKGDYLFGQQNDELKLGTRLIANMDQLLRGWIRWQDNKPAEQLMGLVVEGYKLPSRNTLGWNDQTEWELDDRDQPRDPWQETYYLVLRQLDSSGLPMEGDVSLFTFTTASTGGKDAIKELSAKYAKWYRMRGPDFPIITLGMEKYNHPNKQYGVIKKPKLLFNPKTDWIAKDRFGDIDVDGSNDDEELPF